MRFHIYSEGIDLLCIRKVTTDIMVTKIGNFFSIVQAYVNFDSCILQANHC